MYNTFRKHAFVKGKKSYRHVNETIKTAINYLFNVADELNFAMLRLMEQSYLINTRISKFSFIC